MKEFKKFIANTVSTNDLKDNINEIMIQVVNNNEHKIIIYDNEIKAVLIPIKDYLEDKSNVEMINEIVSLPVQDKTEMSKHENEIKIGELVRRSFEYVESNQLLTDDQINKLSDIDYSKRELGLGFPMLKKFDKKIPISEQLSAGTQFYRYWKQIYIFNETEFWVTSQWYERQRVKYIEWYCKSFKIHPLETI